MLSDGKLSGLRVVTWARTLSRAKLTMLYNTSLPTDPEVTQTVIPIKYRLISTIPQCTVLADGSGERCSGLLRFLPKEPQISHMLHLRAVKIRTSQWHKGKVVTKILISLHQVDVLMFHWVSKNTDLLLVQTEKPEYFSTHRGGSQSHGFPVL